MGEQVATVYNASKQVMVRTRIRFYDYAGVRSSTTTSYWLLLRAV